MRHPLVITVINGGLGARGSDGRSTFRYERLGHSDDDTQLATLAILNRLPVPAADHPPRQDPAPPEVPPSGRRGEGSSHVGGRLRARTVLRWSSTASGRTGADGADQAPRLAGCRVLEELRANAAPGSLDWKIPGPRAASRSRAANRAAREEERTGAMWNNGIVKAFGRVDVKLDVPGLLTHPTARKLAGPASTMVLRRPRGRVDKATDF